MFCRFSKLSFPAEFLLNFFLICGSWSSVGLMSVCPLESRRRWSTCLSNATELQIGDWCLLPFALHVFCCLWWTPCSVLAEWLDTLSPDTATSQVIKGLSPSFAQLLSLVCFMSEHKSRASHIFSVLNGCTEIAQEINLDEYAETEYIWGHILPAFHSLMFNAYSLFCMHISPGKRVGFCKALCFSFSLASLKAETCSRHRHSFMHIYCCSSIREPQSDHQGTMQPLSCVVAGGFFPLPAYNCSVPTLL